jgi:hypothetical protein
MSNAPQQTKEQCLQDNIDSETKIVGVVSGLYLLNTAWHSYNPNSALAQIALYVGTTPLLMLEGTFLTCNITALHILGKKIEREKDDAIILAKGIGYTALVAGAMLGAASYGSLAIPPLPENWLARLTGKGIFAVSPILLSVGIGSILGAYDKTSCECGTMSGQYKIVRP